MLPAGLRWRLTAWVAGVMLVAAAVMFVVIYEYTGAELRNQIDRDIASDTSQLSHLLDTLRGQNPSQTAAVAQRYVSAQPYTANSTLLFVLVPGARTVSSNLRRSPPPVPKTAKPFRSRRGRMHLASGS
jgi:hypothetical protein